MERLLQPASRSAEEVQRNDLKVWDASPSGRVLPVWGDEGRDRFAETFVCGRVSVHRLPTPFGASNRVVLRALSDRYMIAGDNFLPLLTERKVDDFLYGRITALIDEQIQEPRQRILVIGQVCAKWHSPFDRDSLDR